MISFLRPIEYKRTEIKKENSFVKKIFWSILNFQQSVNEVRIYSITKEERQIIEWFVLDFLSSSNETEKK